MLTLTLKAPLPAPVDLSPITPDALAGKTRSQIAALTLHMGNRIVRVDEWCDVEGESDGDILLRGTSLRTLSVGAGMSGGTLRVEGAVGMYAGAQMRGGTLHIEGDAGAFAACAMHGGVLRIHGDAGDFVGGPLPGARRGMDGGMVVVEGRAGDRTGDRMRRGIIVVGGDVGAYCGARMLAGTIIVRGTVGVGVGAGMQRGTLVLTRAPVLAGTFSDCGVHSLAFLRLLDKALVNATPPSLRFSLRETVHRFVGDRAYAGHGEILVEQ
jgi:formylmethanofuran dehydrogenase subunit C